MKKKILVVDNNPVILTLLSRFFQDRGHSVRTAENGLEALDALETFIPHIIFTDLIMPKISGDLFCKIVRSRPEFDKVFLVILSAVAVEENIDFVGLGADGCIAKGPMTEMALHFDEILTQSSAGRQGQFSKEILGIRKVSKREITTELLLTKKHFETTLENMGDGFVEITPEAQIIYANTLATSMFDCPQEKLLSSKLCDHFSRIYRQRIKKCLRNSAKSPIETGEEQPLLLNDRYVLLKFVQIEEESHTSIIVLIRDITKRKKVEEKLQEHLDHLEETIELRTREYLNINKILQREIEKKEQANTQLEQIARQWRITFDTIPDFISIHDKDMRFIRVNRAMATSLNVKPSELIGKHCYEVLHNSNRPLPNCPHKKALETEETVTSELDDTELGVPIHLTCSAYCDHTGETIGTVHVGRDISLQRKYASEREELIKQLQDALSKVKLLSGILPICSSCKNIRDDKGYWSQVESYIKEHSEAEFSHGLCPDCAHKLYPEVFEDL